jgi:hypothetical protein
MADETAPAARLRPSRARAVAALGVVGLSAAALLAGAWVVRIWAVDLLLHGATAQRGAQGDWRLTKVDLSGARLENVRIGPAERPDFQARAITASFAWGFGPRLDAITVEGGRLRARWTDKGLDLGHVGRLVSAGGAAKRRGLPDLTVEAPGLGADIDSPIGRILIAADASGRLGRDFRADARILTPTGAAASGRFAGLSGGLAGVLVGPILFVSIGMGSIIALKAFAATIIGALIKAYSVHREKHNQLKIEAIKALFTSFLFH